MVIQRQHDGVVTPDKALNLIVIAANSELIRINHPGRSRRPDAATTQHYRIEERFMECAGGSRDGDEVLQPRPLLIRQPVAD